MGKFYALGAAVLGCLWVADGCSARKGAEDKPQVTLNAVVAVGPSKIVITNEDSFAWTHATLELNPAVGVDSTEYYGMKIAVWPAGTKQILPLAGFTKGKEHYNPAVTPLQEVVIRCDISGGAGEGFYDADFSK